MSNFNALKNRQDDWHPADIKATLEKKGLTLSKLAQKHGYSRSSASSALYRPWPKMEAIIAAAIGSLPQLIWPSRYDAYGRPNRQPGRPRIKKHRRG